MSLMTKLVFNDTCEVFNRRLMIAEPMIKCAQRVVTQRRWVGHDIEQTLAVFDHLVNLKTIPAPLFFTQDRVGCDIEIEDPFHFTGLRTMRAKPNYKHYASDKHQEHR